MITYKGEPTNEEMLERLAMWELWSPGRGLRDNDLRINHPCPCCGSGKNTESVRDEWNICYTCMIAFTLDDLMPVRDPTEPVILQPYEEDSD